ncbi:MAG: hypothetical protein JXO22_04995 [Phycisphaerae bacterium]|nr:hypothetical protein [Phycisphaerae bacterium]
MRISIAQMPGTTLGVWRDTLALIEQLVAEAHAQRSDLLVLPECAFPAYFLDSLDSYRAARHAGLPGDTGLLEHACGWARRHEIALCVSYVAECGERLRNAATLIDAGGRIIGTHHKCFLWGFDREWFDAGDSIAVFDTPLGRIGMMICADARLPEISATLATRGAQLILQPTAWVNTGAPDQPRNPQPEYLIAARAREFGVPIASASKYGVEGGTLFVGSSLICDQQGNVLVQARQDETTVLTAEVTPATPRGAALCASERAVLLADTPPTSPHADVATLGITIMPELPAWLSAAQARDFLAAMADVAAGAPRLIASTDRLEGHIRSEHLAVVDDPGIGTCSAANITIGAVVSADATRFAPIRVLALRGVHLVVIFGDAVHDDLLATRALENRVFLLVLGNTRARLLDPAGNVIRNDPRPAGEPVNWTVDVRPAANKCVTAGTDVLADRRPAQYAL